jgi:hypothetical protein
MKVVNLTPHDIRVVDFAGDVHTFPASGTVARVATVRTERPAIGGFRAVAQEMGTVQGIPENGEIGTVFLVSMAVFEAYKGPATVVSPDTGPDAIRENGQIVAVRGFRTA